MMWHDTEHVLQAWTMFRKRQARLAFEQRVEKRLKDLEWLEGDDGTLHL